MKLSPFADFVVLKQAKMPDSIGGLVIPDNYRHTLPYGEVVAVGPDVKRCQVGDRVYFEARACASVPGDGEMVLVVKEEHLHCLVEGVPSQIITSFVTQGMEQ